MIVAELEIYHSRPIAPTRRIGIGYMNIPTDPSPGLGGVLLAGIVANSISGVHAEDREELFNLFTDLSRGKEVFQPAVRHRLQDDLIGLSLSTQSLINNEGRLSFQIEHTLAHPVQLVLGALYAAQALPKRSSKLVFEAIEQAWVWKKDVDLEFIDHILNWNNFGKFSPNDFEAWGNPFGWALDILALEDKDGTLSKRVIQKRFRALLREAHPDQGGKEDSAGDRIQQLSDARDILISKI